MRFFSHLRMPDIGHRFFLKIVYILPIGYMHMYVLSYNTGRNFETIFMKFIWLMQVHSWVNTIVFGNKQRPDRTTDMGDMCPQNQFFGFKSDGMGCSEKKT